MSTTIADRETWLAAAVAEWIKLGWRVESRIGDRVIMVKGGTRKKVNRQAVGVDRLGTVRIMLL